MTECNENYQLVQISEKGDLLQRIRAVSLSKTDIQIIWVKKMEIDLFLEF